MFSNWTLQSKEFNQENFNTSAITLKRHALKQELHVRGKSRENVAHQSPRGNMHKLFDCIRAPLKRFLFHRKERRLRQFHERSNTGSAPAHHLPSSPFCVLSCPLSFID